MANGKVLPFDEDATLQECGIKDGERLALKERKKSDTLCTTVCSKDNIGLSERCCAVHPIFPMEACVSKWRHGDALTTRFRVMANGVGGTRSSLGRILACDVQIAAMSILCSFDVLPSDVQDADERTIRFEKLGCASFVAPEEAEAFKPFSETTNECSQMRIN
ncbi:hypothetical protein OSTOST_04630 [Ostertagia ostertagi]